MKHPSRMFPVVKECTQSMWSCLKPSLLNWRRNQPAPMSHPRIATIVSSRTPDRMLYRRPLASIWKRRARPCALRRCREGCVRARDAVASEAIIVKDSSSFVQSNSTATAELEGNQKNLMTDDEALARQVAFDRRKPLNNSTSRISSSLSMSGAIWEPVRSMIPFVVSPWDQIARVSKMHLDEHGRP